MSISSTNNKSEWNASAVRKKFVDYFVTQKDHTFIKSSSTIPHEDPTLLFTNSGMAQVNFLKESLFQSYYVFFLYSSSQFSRVLWTLIATLES